MDPLTMKASTPSKLEPEMLDKSLDDMFYPSLEISGDNDPNCTGLVSDKATASEVCADSCLVDANVNFSTSSHDSALKPSSDLDFLEPHTSNLSSSLDTSLKAQKQMSKAKSILRAERLPRVGGVCFDKNRQRWIAHWKVSGKYVKNYFPVNHYGFDEARHLAIRCRHEAEKRLNLPAIQSRHCISPASVASAEVKGEVNTLDNVVKKLDNNAEADENIAVRQSPSIDTFYDGRQKCWVASYTVFEQFPVGVYGYAEARRRALECKRAHERSKEELKFPSNDGNSGSSRVKISKKGENLRKMELFDMGISQNKHSVALTQEAIYIVLNDLHESCLPAVSGKLSQVTLKKYDNVLCYHKNVVRGATCMQHLKIYLALFQCCILEHLLPSDRTEREQLQMLAELHKNMIEEMNK